ncbi:MAG TPA: S8 family serine peptidase, partial [Alphaproteobacteria bacterium]|nr:S8 family serine peptidase [Alphaproteobacteria bacterium]
MDNQSETNDVSLIEDERENRSPHSFTNDVGFLNAAMRSVSQHSNVPHLSLSSHQNTSSSISNLLSTTSTYVKGTPVDPGFTAGDTWEQSIYTGQYGINIGNVWQDYTGDGVLVGLIDDGFNYNHSELSPNFRTDLDYDVLSNDFDSINDPDDAHGTWAAQIIGADDNGVGNVGVAFDADLVGIRSGFENAGTTKDTLDAFQYALDNDFDVINDGWGVTTAFGDNIKINFFGTDTLDVVNKFEDLVEFGRDGLGANIVFASGNGREDGMSANYKNYQNSPYTITVSSINETGTYSLYSEAGPNVLVTAPGDNIVVSSADDDGTASLVSGTSFAAPAVSGVIALMLEANPELGYRDVQEILALSSRQIDTDGTGWANEGWQINGAANVNGGGMHFSHDYGFGLVDAQAAVRLAETWTLQQTFSNMAVIDPVMASPALAIPDLGAVTTTIEVTQDIEIEQVLIDLDISHTKAGDLTVTLISPSGTESVLVYNINNGAFTTAFGVYNGINFEFSSVAHWGESSLGEWTLKIEDNVSGNIGTLNNWSVSFLGNEHSVDDLYVYTNDYALASAENHILNDTDGGIDTLNAAAVTSDTVIDLSSGGTIAGTEFIIEAGTVIENVYTGDGNDHVTGNHADNVLNAGRGDDTLYGGIGNDTLIGGSGNDIIYGGNGDGATFIEMGKEFI